MTLKSLPSRRQTGKQQLPTSLHLINLPLIAVSAPKGFPVKHHSHTFSDAQKGRDTSRHLSGLCLTEVPPLQQGRFHSRGEQMGAEQRGAVAELYDPPEQPHRQRTHDLAAADFHQEIQLLIQQIQLASSPSSLPCSTEPQLGSHGCQRVPVVSCKSEKY